MKIEAIKYKDAKRPIPNPLTQQQIYKLPRQAGIKHEELALIYLTYLTGGRITEVLRIKASDFRKEQTPYGPEIILNLWTLKNRRKATRELIIPIYAKWEQHMWGIIRELAKRRQLENDDYLFLMQRGGTARWYREKAWRITKKIKFTIIYKNAATGETEETLFGMNPHYLRHCRLTHMVQLYNYSIPQLIEFAGWSNSAPAMRYIHLDWRDQAETIRKGAKEKGLWQPQTTTTTTNNDIA